LQQQRPAKIAPFAMNRNVAVALAGALLLAACGPSEAPAPALAASAGAAPVAVSTVRAERRDMPVELEATGTVSALNSVDIKPQVPSTIAAVHFREGQFLKAGQLLFTLDARAGESEVARARAQLRKDLAALADAQRQLARSKELLAQNFVSQGAVDANQTLADTQRAAVEADRAALKTAEVGLSYTRIVAPLAGRAGSVDVHPGTSVQPGGPALVTITQLDPISVAFSLPQRHLHDALDALHAGGGRVVAELPEGRGTLTGRLDFVDNAVDANSGTVKVKAVFDNRDERLWPGAFVGVRLAVRTLSGAVVVPQAAIVQGARGRIVYVAENGKAVAREVEVVHAAGPDAAVTGVEPGARVIVEGRQNVRPGGAVVERAAGIATS
jgi:RND family efflux transporter MFP subunit